MKKETKHRFPVGGISYGSINVGFLEEFEASITEDRKKIKSAIYCHKLLSILSTKQKGK